MALVHMLRGSVGAGAGGFGTKLKPRWNLHFRDDEGQAKVLGEGFQPAHKAGPLLPLSLHEVDLQPVE